MKLKLLRWDIARRNWRICDYEIVNIAFFNTWKAYPQISYKYLLKASSESAVIDSGLCVPLTQVAETELGN